MRIISTFIFCFAGILLISCQKTVTNEIKTGTLKLTFRNMVKGNPIDLVSTNYINGNGEQYNITKFKYYISHATVSSNGISTANKNYYLIDEADIASRSFSFEVPVNMYASVSFLLGVDSTRNVSGAQTGALDPLNDMFWTWNSGYIMAKMEGVSPQSTVVNNKVEYHIGGFAGVNSVLKNIVLPVPVSTFSPVDIREGKTSEIFIQADFDTWWQGSYDLKIATTPAVTHPGALAKNISDNYSNMFSISDIKNY